MLEHILSPKMEPVLIGSLGERGIYGFYRGRTILEPHVGMRESSVQQLRLAALFAQQCIGRRTSGLEIAHDLQGCDHMIARTLEAEIIGAAKRSQRVGIVASMRQKEPTNEH